MGINLAKIAEGIPSGTIKTLIVFAKICDAGVEREQLGAK
jgi:hypothetical protein